MLMEEATETRQQANTKRSNILRKTALCFALPTNSAIDLNSRPYWAIRQSCLFVSSRAGESRRYHRQLGGHSLRSLLSKAKITKQKLHQSPVI
jgi:hypothetical protein